MSVSVDAFRPRMSERHMWTIDAANITHVLSIYGGHFGDLLFHTVGFPARLTAVVENQFPTVTIEETGEEVPYASPNEVMVIGTLEGGGLFSVQLEGAQRHRTLDASVQDVAYLYAAYGRDRQNGTSEASDFRDAVRMHHVIDQICSSSEEFLRRDTSS
jgi:predicted dehydrogenase